MFILIDCNVLIAAALTNGTCRSVLQWALHHHSIILSEDIVLKYGRVCKRDRFRSFQKELQELVTIICQLVILVDPVETNWVLPDPDALKYIQAGLACREPVFLLTGNSKDFPQKQYDFITILSPYEVYEKWILLGN